MWNTLFMGGLCLPRKKKEVISPNRHQPFEAFPHARKSFKLKRPASKAHRFDHTMPKINMRLLLTRSLILQVPD